MLELLITSGFWNEIGSGYQNMVGYGSESGFKIWSNPGLKSIKNWAFLATLQLHPTLIFIGIVVIILEKDYKGINDINKIISTYFRRKVQISLNVNKTFTK